MATQKKIRQRETMKIKKILGLKDISLARKLQKRHLSLSELQMELDTHPELKDPTYKQGCACCGVAFHTWNTRRGIITHETHRGFTFEPFTQQNNP